MIADTIETNAHATEVKNRLIEMKNQATEMNTEGKKTEIGIVRNSICCMKYAYYQCFKTIIWFFIYSL